MLLAATKLCNFRQLMESGLGFSVDELWDWGWVVVERRQGCCLR